MDCIREYARQIRDVPGDNLTTWEHEYASALLSIAGVVSEMTTAAAVEALELVVAITEPGSATRRAARKASELISGLR